MTTLLNAQSNPFLTQSRNGAGFKGLHTKGTWLDKGAILFDEGLTVEAQEDNFIFTLENGTSHNVEASTLIGAALFEPLQGKGASLEDMLVLWSNGYIAKAQEQFAESGTKKEAGTDESNPLLKAGTVINAEQYLKGSIYQGLDIKNYQTIADIVLQVRALKPAATKAEILELLLALTDVFLTEESYTTYTAKVLDEEEAAKKFKVLVDNGYNEVKQVAQGLFTAKLAITDLAKIGLLTENKFALVGTTPIDSGLNFLISFKSVEETKEETKEETTV